MTTPSDIVPIADAVRILSEKGYKVSERTVRYWADTRKIQKFQRTGHWVYVSVSEVEEQLKIKPVE